MRAPLSLLAVVVAATLTMPAHAALSGKAASASAANQIPYRVGAPLPAYRSSPAIPADAPYTPVVKNLIHQLLPSNPPTPDELVNAVKLFDGLINIGTNGSCHTVGYVAAPTGTTPSIAPLCWADSVGINITSGGNGGRTSATAEPLAIGATFDRHLSNAWGQVEGAEGRRLMVTGLYGPEADVSVQPNWERGLDTLGEDPYLNEVLTAAQVDGIQSRGLMAQVKHFAAFTGANRYTLTQVGDQALHEMLLTPFEAAFTQAKAASTMCAYEEYQDTSSKLPKAPKALYPKSPYAATAAEQNTKTWPLNERHWACEQPLALSYVLRWMWHSVAFVGSDYPATHSTAAMTQGESQEFFTPTFFGPQDPTDPTTPALTVGRGNDPTGDVCVIGAVPADCSASGARHIGGIAGPGCNPQDGCGLVSGVETGNFPVSVFKQALAEILYEEQRFGLLGCDDSPRAQICTNPGGVNGDRSGNAGLPTGPATGATAAHDLGTEDGDAAVVEQLAEEGAVLLKNHHRALPLRGSVLRKGVAVSGAGAEYLVAAPSNEASTGFPERTRISPLAQLRKLAGGAGHLSFSPADDPTGYAVPRAELSTTSGRHDGGLSRTAGPNSPRKDPTLDFTTVTRRLLSPGDYTWSGYVFAPRADDYTFRFQSTYNTASSGNQAITFSLDGKAQTLSQASSFYCGQYYAHNVCVPVATTNPGFTQGGLQNQQTPSMKLTRGYHQVSIQFRNDTSAPASFRFAYSRVTGDAVDAAATARGKSAAVVFVNDGGVSTVNQDAYTPPAQGVARLPKAQVRLINAVAAANPHTIVVMNTADPVVVRPWAGMKHVRAILEMWNAGSEGGTATARLLLGRADPSGHTTITWPVNPSDTIWGYNQTRPLYAGDRRGKHPERLNGLTDTSAADCQSYEPPPSPCTRTLLDEGIFSGYRFYDRERLAPQYPFGFGLSYTRFRFSALHVHRTGDGGADVSFRVRNIGHRTGAAVAQVYVGPGPHRQGVEQAVRALRGFARVELPPGRSHRLTIHLDARSFQYWNSTKQRWTRNLGKRVVYVGDADAPRRLPLRETMTVR